MPRAVVARNTRSSRRRGGPPCAWRSRSSSSRRARRRRRTSCRSSTRCGRAGPRRRSGACSIAAADAGWLETTTARVDLSTQRNAGMSMTEPWRMPHWLTPVCDDHPVSQPISRWLPSRSQRWRVGRRPIAAPGRAPVWPARRSAQSRRRVPRSRRRSPVPARSPGHRRLEPGVVVEGEEARHQRRDGGQPEDDHEGCPPAFECAPGSVSSTRATTIASSTIAPSPSVRTEIGTTMLPGLATRWRSRCRSRTRREVLATTRRSRSRRAQRRAATTSTLR